MPKVTSKMASYSSAGHIPGGGQGDAAKFLPLPSPAVNGPGGSSGTRRHVTLLMADDWRGALSALAAPVCVPPRCAAPRRLNYPQGSLREKDEAKSGGITSHCFICRRYCICLSFSCG